MGNGNLPTQPSLLTDLSKEKQLVMVFKEVRQLVAIERNVLKLKKKKELKILMVAVRVERRPQCREIGGTEDSRKTGSQLQS